MLEFYKAEQIFDQAVPARDRLERELKAVLGECWQVVEEGSAEHRFSRPV